jgi:hypothetical protein
LEPGREEAPLKKGGSKGELPFFRITTTGPTDISYLRKVLAGLEKLQGNAGGLAADESAASPPALTLSMDNIHNFLMLPALTCR